MPAAAARTLALTLLALAAFAANSLLCRVALRSAAIDAVSFTSIRVLAGASILYLILQLRSARAVSTDWRMVAALFAYMALFSWAYQTLAAGTGALMLFGSVQLTMFGAGLVTGERFDVLGWSGTAVAVAGLIYLLAPGLQAPDPIGALLMAGAGVAWGAYSLLGRQVEDPVASTASNFLWAVPPTIVLSLVSTSQLHLTGAGVGYAVASGAIASGLGYVVWYAALRGLTAMRAAAAQLAVPVLAALGGVALLAEPVTLRLIVAAAAILGGVAVVLTRRSAPARSPAEHG